MVEGKDERPGAVQRTGLRRLAPEPDAAAAAALTEDQVAQLLVYGETGRVAAGDVLFFEGAMDFDLVVIVEGTVEVLRFDELTGEELVIGAAGPGNFSR